MWQTKNEMFVILLLICSIAAQKIEDNKSVEIPLVLRGEWFSGIERHGMTQIDYKSMSDRGELIDLQKNGGDYTMIFKDRTCYRCMKVFVRTTNVFEKLETPCLNITNEENLTFEHVCSYIPPDQLLTTFFNDDYSPILCESSLQGVWQFAYQNPNFVGECDNPNATIQSCKEPGTKSLVANTKFNVAYKKCQGVEETFNGYVDYRCLGSWKIGRNQYFAVANTRESRKNEKFRCFVKNLDDDSQLGVSVTSECNTLPTVEKSPERLRITPVELDEIEAGCQLPLNYSGEWITSENIDIEVFMNETHIIETIHPANGKTYRNIYICIEKQDSKIVMAKLPDNGCPNDFVCFDFNPKNNNIIRYKKGLAVISSNFSEVCSEENFLDAERKRDDVYVAKNSEPVKCPIGGAFKFTQKGENSFLPVSSDQKLQCQQNISLLRICDSDQKEMLFDENYCLTEENQKKISKSDLKLKCIGFWKENSKSFLITYNDLDPLSQFHCWVYEKTELNQVFMSKAVGAACSINQKSTSMDHKEGAEVALELSKFDLEGSQCQFHFEEGE